MAASQDQPWPPVDATYYTLLDLTPTASLQDIRRAYREKSKLFHPDTTDLPAAIATERFQQLNEAYATLSSPERRLLYDRQIGYSQIPVIQPLTNTNLRTGKAKATSTYSGPSDRPLSAGELFALFLLGLTFLGCLFLAIVVGCTRGEIAFETASWPQDLLQLTVTRVTRLQPSAAIAPTSPVPAPEPVMAPVVTSVLPVPTAEAVPSLPQNDPTRSDITAIPNEQPLPAFSGNSAVQSSPAPD